MEYSWKNKDLNQRLQQLKRMYAKAKTPNEKLEIISAIHSLQECITLYQSFSCKKSTQTKSVQECINFEKDYLESFLFTWNNCCFFQTQMKQVSTIGELNTLSFTKDDLFTIVHDFYQKAIGGTYYQMFLKQFNQRKNHVRFSTVPDFRGQALHVHVLNETFIETQYDKTFADISTLIHEYGHAIHYQGNFAQEDNDNLIPFSEMISIFMELVCYSYFQKTELKTEAIKEKRNCWNFYFDIVQDLAATMNILSIYDEKKIQNGRELRAETRKKLNIADDEFISIFQSDPHQHLSYVYSMLMAIELFTIYEKDPDYAFHIIKKMFETKTLDPLEFDGNLRELGLIPNENVKYFQRTLEKNVQKFITTK